MESHNKIDYLSILGATYILIEPILAMYGWPGLSFARILTYVVVLLFVIKRFSKKKAQTDFPKLLSIYFVWLLICNYLSFASLIPIGTILQILIFIAPFAIIKFEFLLKLYKILAYLFILFFIIQEISFSVTGYRITGAIEWLPICLGGADFDLEHFINYSKEGYRSSSFFSEPSHFAQFLLPLLAIEIYRIKDLRSAIPPLVITVVLLFLASGSGMLGMVCIYSYYAVSVLRSSTLKAKITMCLFLVVISFALYLYMNSNVSEKAFDRDIGNKEASTTSSFVRTFRGYYIYDEYSLLEKVKGINNIETIKKKRDQSSVAWTFADDNDIYVNCVQDILIRTGLIGAIIFIWFIISIWKHNTREGKTIILIFVALSFVASLYMSSTMILYIYLAYNLKRRRQVALIEK